MPWQFGGAAVRGLLNSAFFEPSQVASTVRNYVATLTHRVAVLGLRSPSCHSAVRRVDRYSRRDARELPVLVTRRTGRFAE